MDEFESKVNTYVARHGLIKSDGSPVIVGLSGGADSVALITALTATGVPCIAAHCNFQLRGAESLRDQNHAKQIAELTGCRWITTSFDTREYMERRGISLEMACRELRYRWFDRMLADTGAQAIAVAHHRDDNIETLMLNMLRGSGIRGLRGMKPRNGHVIRPLLGCTRDEVMSYLERRGIDYVTDSSNSVNDVARNRIRNIILPAVYNEFPQARDCISHTIEILADTEALLMETVAKARQEYTTADSGTIGSIDIARLMADHPDTGSTILFELLHPYGFTPAQTRSMANDTQRSGARFHAREATATLSRGIIEITHGNDTDRTVHSIDLNRNVATPLPLTVEHITPAQFKPVRGNSTLYLDAAAMAGSPKWEIRHWRPGDRMKPFGMTGSRKLSDVFTDAKLSLSAKHRVWILTRNDEIIWIPGLKNSSLFPVTKDTMDIVKISYTGE